MQTPSYESLLEAGVHFGHLRRKWNPKMRQNIFMERKGIHIIDLNKTASSMERAGKAAKQIAKSGRKILFVATKRQAREGVAAIADSVNMPHVTDRWLGGMMTNFNTIRKSIKKMKGFEDMLNDGTAKSMTKKEQLMLTREHAKMKRVFGGIENLNRLPVAVFLVDITHEHLALSEAKKLGLRTFGMVDTNSDPTSVDFAIPANDDASKSILLITQYIADCIKEGLEERQKSKSNKEETEA